MKFRSRLVAALSAVTALAMGAAFASVFLRFTQAQQDDLDAALRAEAEEEAIDTSLLEGQLALRDEPVASWNDLGPLTRYRALYDDSGQSVAWSRSLERGRPRLDLLRHTVGMPFDFWFDNEHLRAVLVPVPRHRELTLFVAAPRAMLDGHARVLARAMVVAILAGIAAVVGCAAWLVRLLTRDHRRIADVARRVAAGDLTARVGANTLDLDTLQVAGDIDEMIGRLALLVETQQRFIANASHELRSPITALYGELSFALRREREPAAYRDAIAEALDAARRLKTLTEDLLALARVGATELAAEAASLADVVEAAVKGLRGEAGRRGVILEANVDTSVVQGRSSDLERLVRNLVENAARHSPAGGRVRVRSRRDGSSALISISDEGPGVRAEDRERIFEPFYRGPGAKSGGAGLGLAIARSIARAHGGDLWLEDARGGATFVARVPAVGPFPVAGLV